MSNEEAIIVLGNLPVYPDDSYCVTEYQEAKTIAIEALGQQRIGHWILADVQNKEDVVNDNFRFICSECLCSDIHAKNTIVPYCWKCGAKMIEPQESEE